MKIKILIPVLAFLFLQAFTKIDVISEPTVHVIMFIEDNPSEKIYSSCQKDGMQMKAELSLVKKYAEMKIKYYTTSFNKNSMNSVISNLKCGKDDVILFYYNGHGYNEGNSYYPCLNFNESSYSNTHINLEEQHEKLKKKGARLVLTIGDCCNNYRGAHYPSLTEKRKRALQYINLFRLSKGDMLVASSKKGQYSYVYKNGSGSYFTLSFLDALHDAVDSKKATWGYILEQTKLNTLA